MITGNIKLMKKMNTDTLRNVMKQKKIFKKMELAETSGLSVVTINSLLTELIKAKEVIETNKLAKTGGRKAVLYEYNANYQLILTICLFERNKQEIAHVLVCNLFGDVVFEKEFLFSSIQSDQFVDLIETHLKKYTNISLITIGIPGLENNGLLKIMDFEGLYNENLRTDLESKFNIPVLIENDINIATFGCYLKSENKIRSIVGIYYPTNHPPGAGVVLNGALLKGKNGMVGEIKYLPFDIKWKHFSFQKNELKQHALKVAITIGSLYDPEQYVFYGEIFDNDFAYEIENTLLKTFPNIEKPVIISKENFHHNYLKGIIAISLDYLSQNVK